MLRQWVHSHIPSVPQNFAGLFVLFCRFSKKNIIFVYRRKGKGKRWQSYWLIKERKHVRERNRRSPLAGSCLCFFLGTGLVSQQQPFCGFCYELMVFVSSIINFKKAPIPTSARALHETWMSKLQSNWFLDAFWVDCVLLPVVYKFVWFICCNKSLTSECSCTNLQQESFIICLLSMLTELFI